MMSYYAESYMLVGFKYKYDEFKDMAVNWFKETNASFKEQYEKQLKVVGIMPQYQSDLDSLNDQALDEFYGDLHEQGIVRISEHHGFDYIGFPVDCTVNVDAESLNQFCQDVQNKSAELYKIFGNKGTLISAHDYS